jgi:hypothetical protein
MTFSNHSTNTCRSTKLQSGIAAPSSKSNHNNIVGAPSSVENDAFRNEQLTAAVNPNDNRSLVELETKCQLNHQIDPSNVSVCCDSSAVTNSNNNNDTATMNIPVNMLNVAGKRVPHLLSRDLSFASIPVTPSLMKQCDENIVDSTFLWNHNGRRRSRNLLDLQQLQQQQQRANRRVSFRTLEDNELSICYIPPPETPLSEEEANECFYSVSVQRRNFQCSVGEVVLYSNLLVLIGLLTRVLLLSCYSCCRKQTWNSLIKIDP